MMRSRWPQVALATLVLWAITFTLGWCSGRHSERTSAEDAAAVATLHGEHYVTAEEVKRPVPDLPAAATGLAHVTGRVEAVPRSPAIVSSGPEPGPAAAAPPTPSAHADFVSPQTAAPGSGSFSSWPASSDLGGTCDCRLVRVGRDVLGRVEWSAYLLGPAGQRVAERGPEPAGESRLEVAPALTRPRPLLEMRLLATAPVGWRAGVTLYPRRSWWGICGEYTRQGDRQDGAVGVAIRF